MDPHAAEARPPLTAIAQVAALLEHSLLSPTLANDWVTAAVQAAPQGGIAAVLVRPCDVDLAVRLLDSSRVKVATVAGFPHGTASTAVKLYEARDLLRRGAREIAMTINPARLLSREFQSVQTELLQMSEACRKEGAVLKVALETGYLTDELKTIACGCCERADVHVVKTTTGFGPAPADEGADLALLRENLPEDIGVEAGPVASLDALLALYEQGVGRVASADPRALLAEWKARQKA